VSPRAGGGRLEPGRRGNGKCTGSGKKRGQEGGGIPHGDGKQWCALFSSFAVVKGKKTGAS